MGKLDADWSRVSHARANAADSSFSLFFSVTQSCVVNELKSEREILREKFWKWNRNRLLSMDKWREMASNQCKDSLKFQEVNWRQLSLTMK